MNEDEIVHRQGLIREQAFKIKKEAYAKLEKAMKTFREAADAKEVSKCKEAMAFMRANW